MSLPPILFIAYSLMFIHRRVRSNSCYSMASRLNFLSLTLGGGFGWLCSEHGLVIDNLVQVTLVTSSGDILTASDSQNQDLF